MSTENRHSSFVIRHLSSVICLLGDWEPNDGYTHFVVFRYANRDEMYSQLQALHFPRGLQWRHPSSNTKMKRIAILTAGGDTPALNATLSGAVIRANQRRVEMVGIIKGFSGLLNPNVPHLLLNP